MNYQPYCKRLEVINKSTPSSSRVEREVKLFYGDKDHEYWLGPISVYEPKQKDPFWQISPERNPNVYHEVKGFGDRAVYNGLTSTLVILKKGIL